MWAFFARTALTFESRGMFDIQCIITLYKKCIETLGMQRAFATDTMRLLGLQSKSYVLITNSNYRLSCRFSILLYHKPLLTIESDQSRLTC